jgi:hypothetical protein
MENSEKYKITGCAVFQICFNVTHLAEDKNSGARGKNVASERL